MHVPSSAESAGIVSAGLDCKARPVKRPRAGAALETVEGLDSKVGSLQKLEKQEPCVRW